MYRIALHRILLFCIICTFWCLHKYQQYIFWFLLFICQLRGVNVYWQTYKQMRSYIFAYAVQLGDNKMQEILLVCLTACRPVCMSTTARVLVEDFRIFVFSRNYMGNRNKLIDELFVEDTK